MATGTLIITRPRQYTDMLRHYRIMVDDRDVGRIERGGELRVDLPCGDHRIVARIDWARSNELSVGIREREITEVEVGSNVRGWALLAAIYFATVGSRHSLYLRHRATGFPVAVAGAAAAR